MNNTIIHMTHGHNVIAINSSCVCVVEWRSARTVKYMIIIVVNTVVCTQYTRVRIKMNSTILYYMYVTHVDQCALCYNIIHRH